MGDNEPESQSLSPQVQGTAWWARELSASCKEGSQERWAAGQAELPSPAGQSLWRLMPREISVVWSSTLVCGAWLSQRWSGTCLSYTLESVIPTLLGLFDKCLGIPDANWGICPGTYGWHLAVLLDTPSGKYGIFPGACLWVVPLCRHGCSDHVCRYLECVSLPDVFTLT